MKVELKLSCHDMFCIEEKNLTQVQHRFLRNIVLCNWMDDERYKIAKQAGAFLQGGYDQIYGWILIEFWKPNGAENFINYVNEHGKNL